MSTLRLNNSHREALTAFAHKVVRENHKMTEGHDALYKEMQSLARSIVTGETPEADLKLLRKYGCTRFIVSPKFVKHSTSDVFEVDLLKLTPDHNVYADDGVSKRHGIEVPLDTSRGYSGKLYKATSELTKLAEKYDLEDTEYRRTLNNKIAQYSSVIANCRTYEQLIEIWPEAALLSESLNFNLPVPLSNETIEAVRSESKARMEALKAKLKLKK